MKMLRRRIRRSFLFAAIAFLVLGIADIGRTNYAQYGTSSLRHFGFIAFCLVQGGIYAAAWFTTKTPSPYRNIWAILGSLFTLAWAGANLALHHADILDARAGLIGLVVSAAGLYVFGQGGAPQKPAVEPTTVGAVLTSVLAAPAGQSFVDQPGTVAAASSRFSPNPVQRIPAQPSASSSAIAAAAASPIDAVQSRWDPVSLLRSSTDSTRS